MDALGEVNAREQHRDAESLRSTRTPTTRPISTTAPEGCSGRPLTGSSTGARKRFWRTTASVSGTQTSWSSSPRSICSRRWARRRARPTATAISVGGHAGSRRSARSWPSTAWTIGTPGRSPSSAWGRSGRATTPGLAGARPSGSTMVVFAFGLSEREHGADIYTTDMVLTPDEGGGFEATGGKYYIGNGNVARMVSVFGRRSDVDGPDGYVFFAADSQQENYRLVKNIVQAQMFVAEFQLENYPVSPQDVLHTGQAAFAAALNTVNVGKFNIGPASIGMCEHAMQVEGGHPCPQPHPLRQPRD